MPYLVFAVTPIGTFNQQFGVLRQEAENITSGFVTLGVVQQQGCWQPHRRDYALARIARLLLLDVLLGALRIPDDALIRIRLLIMRSFGEKLEGFHI